MPTLPNASGLSEMEAVKAIGAPKFTRGPWRVDDDPMGSNVYRDNDAYHGVDAGRGYFELNQGGFSLAGHMSIHDAHLIAAAPALYDTLTHLIASARKVSPSDPAAAEIIGMCARAEHEQAKARGEAV